MEAILIILTKWAPALINVTFEDIDWNTGALDLIRWSHLYLKIYLKCKMFWSLLYFCCRTNSSFFVIRFIRSTQRGISNGTLFLKYLNCKLFLFFCYLYLLFSTLDDKILVLPDMEILILNVKICIDFVS